MSAAGLTPGGGIKPDLPFTPVRVAILTISDTRDLANDTSGRVLVERVQAAGHQLGGRGCVQTQPLARALVEVVHPPVNRDLAVVFGYVVEPLRDKRRQLQPTLDTHDRPLAVVLVPLVSTLRQLEYLRVFLLLRLLGVPSEERLLPDVR